MTQESEASSVVQRYARRHGLRARYDMMDPAVWQSVQERQRAIIRMLSAYLIPPVPAASLVEIGCGSGMNLLEMLRLGFRPENLAGNELLEERISAAKEILPSSVRLYHGDSSMLSLADESFDIVLQSGMFTSLLDQQFQTLLALKVWKWVKPGGALLWYDFVFDNPANPDVRAVKPNRIRSLFPDAAVRIERVTLAPPISRRVT